MNEENYWEKFVKTGKIADYIKYKKVLNRYDNEMAGEFHAGLQNSNRNGDSDATDRRIR